ncbi:MAG: peptidylprolyl isomerase [Spirochaetia bacterium]|jgi:hypothetical protein|nr:peptidylprolyl isomerase [Spirochaetia bacterium]
MGTKKQKDTETIVDKKIDKHPVLYVFSFIILVIIVVTFVGAPIASNMSGGTRIVFGKYGDKNIDFYPGNYLSEQRDLLAQNLDKNSNTDIQYQAYQVWRGAFERTVIHTAILWITEKNSVNISENKIDTTLATYGPYTVNGEFSIEKYNSTSRAEKNRIRTTIKESLIKEQYIRDFFEGIKISKNEIDFISDMGKNERSVDIVYTSFDNYPESAMLDFAKDNIDIFKSMELSKITILSSEKDAKKVHSIVTANPDSFSDTAKNQSKDSYADNGGDMGRTFNYTLKMELKNSSDLDKVFALSRGQISPVLETISGWVIYKCNTASQPLDLADSTSITTIKNYMKNYETGKIEDYFIKIAQQISSDDNLIQAAVKNNFKIFKTPSFPINYGNKMLFKNIEIENAPADLKSLNYNEDFFIEAFSLKEGDISDPVILGNSLVLLSLNETAVNEEFASIVDSYYPYILQQLNDQSLTSFFLKSDKLTDNFNTVFSKYFLAN